MTEFPQRLDGINSTMDGADWTRGYTGEEGR
jgi:hypothetical protein